MKSLSNDTYKVVWRILFALWSLHGGIALMQFIKVDSFDYSYRYLLVCVGIFCWVGFSIFLFVASFRNYSVWLLWSRLFQDKKIRDMVFFVSFVFCVFRGVLWYVRTLLGWNLFIQFGGYIDIVSPVLNFGLYIFLEIIVFVVYLNISNASLFAQHFVGLWKPGMIVYTILLLLVFTVRKTGLGILPNYHGDWSRGLPAVPVLEWQIFFVCFLGLVCLYYETKNDLFNKKSVVFFACIIVWFSASIIWLKSPILPSPSLLHPHEPNFEIYPFIDAQLYDTASQSILIGNGFGENSIPQRPLYIEFLAFLHLIVGQDYRQMITIHSFVLAIFPVVLYLLGRELFGTPLGVSLSFLAIFRDSTSSFVAPFTGNLSYSKLFLSEIPTATVLVLSLFIGIRWIKSNFSPFYGYLLGGILGVGMLIRTQAIVALPVILLFGLIAKPTFSKILMKRTSVILISLILLVSPWLWRNWKITGGLIFDNPESQTGNLALRYSRLAGVELYAPRLPDETSLRYADRLRMIAFDAIASNPVEAVWAVTNSFLNHGVNNILVFPLRSEVNSLDELLIPTEAFWEQWEGAPAPSQTVIIIFYLFLFGLGVSVAWHRSKWIGLLPLGLNIFYNLWTSLALLSGQRFMLAMDWSVYLYYLVGLFTLMGCFLFAINYTRKNLVDWLVANRFVFENPSFQTPYKSYFILGVWFLAVGSLLPLSEIVVRDRYPFLSKGVLVDDLISSFSVNDTSVTLTCFKKILYIPEMDIVRGRALYPRYYKAKDGEDSTDALGYKATDESRMVFELIGETSHRVVFPIGESPNFFPHASDVTLVYGPSEADLWFILVELNGEDAFYVSDNFDPSICR